MTWLWKSLITAGVLVAVGIGAFVISVAGVLFHTTALTMTWLFFDADGRLQDYYLCEQ